MSTSERDKDLWKLRQLTKAKNELFSYPCSQEEEATVRRSARFVALQAEFDALFQKYGNNPSIFKDSERAGSKRGVTKKIRAAVTRSEKRSEKQKQRAEAMKQLEQEEVPKYVIRLMFEWGGGCLWCGNDLALKTFDVGPIEDRLPLSDSLRSRLAEMTAWHDGSLNWDYPPDPSPWPPEERERFERAAAEVLAIVQSELGPEIEVEYVPL